MLSSAPQIAWDSSHAISSIQTNARRGKHTDPSAEQAHYEAAMLWQRIERILTDGREQRVAYLLFHCGLTPQEIVQRCTAEFTEVQEVLSLRCAIMKKLIHIV